MRRQLSPKDGVQVLLPVEAGLLDHVAERLETRKIVDCTNRILGIRVSARDVSSR
jgi:hypothetical protein